MGARIVFVHGIGGPRDPAAELAEWVKALAEGCRGAGHSRFAQALFDGTVAETRFAYYGDLFSRPQAQRVELSALSDEDIGLCTSLLIDSIDDHLLTLGEGDDAETVRLLERARSQLAAQGQSQGAPDLIRRALNAATTLLSAPPLRKGGQWAVNKLLVKDFAQVARYLLRAERDGEGRCLDVRIRERLATVLDAEATRPTIIVAHSLGSVVALETLHEATAPVQLLVTIGSPIATRTVVWPRLRPQPPSTPEVVRAWLNFWDKDDMVVSRPRLEKDVAANFLGVVPRSRRVDSDGLWVHSAVTYLRRPDVAGPIAEAAQSLVGPDGVG